jgi:hypothetical protein
MSNNRCLKHQAGEHLLSVRANANLHRSAPRLPQLALWMAPGTGTSPAAQSVDAQHARGRFRTRRLDRRVRHRPQFGRSCFEWSIGVPTVTIAERPRQTAHLARPRSALRPAELGTDALAARCGCGGRDGFDSWGAKVVGSDVRVGHPARRPHPMTGCAGPESAKAGACHSGGKPSFTSPQAAHGELVDFGTEFGGCHASGGTALGCPVMPWSEFG